MKVLLNDLVCWLIGHKPRPRNAPCEIWLNGKLVTYTKTEFACVRCGESL